MDTVRVLAIDGGGIRGIVPATVLAEVERLSGRPTSALFDLVAGTSTGGILALGLTCPDAGGEPAHTAVDLVGLYEQEGPRIFSRSLWRTVRSIGGLVDERYDAGPLEAALARYLGDTTMRQALAEVFVTAYDLPGRQPFFFRSSRAALDAAYDFPMRVAARATSAAPTYFEPLEVPGIGGDPRTYCLADGGVYANNPTMCAFAEARARYPDATRFVILSLGTGEQTRPIPCDEARGWGLLEWAVPVLGVVFDGVGDTVQYQVEQLVGAFPSSLQVRLQPRLVVGNDDLDDASATNISALKLLAEQLVEAERPVLESIVAELTAVP